MKKSPDKKTTFEKSAQDRFLMQMMEEHKKVAIFLVSGIKLEGEIEAYDQFVILLKGTTTDTVYKHAVSTIQPVDGSRPAFSRPPRENTSRTPTIRQARTRTVRRPDES